MSANGLDPDAIAEGMMTLLAERLKNPERRAKISDTVAAKFFAEANKLAERRKAEQEHDETVPRDVLEIVQSADIQIERKDRIVDAEIERLEEKIMQLRLLKERRYAER